MAAAAPLPETGLKLVAEGARVPDAPRESSSRGRQERRGGPRESSPSRGERGGSRGRAKGGGSRGRQQKGKEKASQALVPSILVPGEGRTHFRRLAPMLDRILELRMVELRAELERLGLSYGGSKDVMHTKLRAGVVREMAAARVLQSLFKALFVQNVRSRAAYKLQCFFRCATRRALDDGAVFCFGHGAHGALGHGGARSLAAPRRVKALRIAGEPLAKASGVCAGDGHTVAVTEDGLLFHWGAGVCGTGNTGITSPVGTGSTKPALAEALRQNRVRIASGAAGISAGATHSCAVSAAGALFTWGYGFRGQLGHNDEAVRMRPVVVRALQAEVVTVVSAGQSHTAAVTRRGELYTWGCGKHGKLGNGKLDMRLAPTVVPYFRRWSGAKAYRGHRRVRSCSAGASHTAAIGDKGELYMWGSTANGLLGVKLPKARELDVRAAAPERVHTLVGPVAQVSCGHTHTAAVLEDGTCWTWGSGVNGALGHGDQDGRRLPTLVTAFAAEVPAEAESTDDAAGGEHPATSSPDAAAAAAARIVAHVPIRFVSAGDGSTGAITAGGDLHTWGFGRFSNLGHGNERDRLRPGRVAALPGRPLARVSSVSMGDAHTAACVNANGLSIYLAHSNFWVLRIRLPWPRRARDVEPLHFAPLSAVSHTVISSGISRGALKDDSRICYFTYDRSVPNASNDADYARICRCTKAKHKPKEVVRKSKSRRGGKRSESPSKQRASPTRSSS